MQLIDEWMRSDAEPRKLYLLYYFKLNDNVLGCEIPIISVEERKICLKNKSSKAILVYPAICCEMSRLS
jgi:hypothetical protein